MKHPLSTSASWPSGSRSSGRGGGLSRANTGDPIRVGIELGDELKTGAESGKRACDALDPFTSRTYSAMEAKAKD